MTIITREGAQLADADRGLDERIWLIARESFDDEHGDILVSDERFKLTRWPNLGLQSQTLSQMRMTAMLDLMFLSVHDLALAADVLEAEAQRLVKAFNLMGILQRSDDRATVSLTG